MPDFGDLLAKIPTREIAAMLDADEGEVDSAVQTLVPVLVGSLQQNAEDPEHAAQIEAAAGSHAARGLLDAGPDQLDQADAAKAIAKIFGGNDTDQVAAALAGGGAGDSELIKKLMPILVPIVLAYIGKQLVGKKTAPAAGEAAEAESDAGAGGVLGDVLGSILGGGGGGKSAGSILGDLLGSKAGGAIGDILGGLLRGKK